MQLIGNVNASLMLDLPQEVKRSLQGNLTILDESYGEDRHIQKDLGGYAMVAEVIEDIETIKQEIIRGTVPEDVEEIICGDGQVYCSSLFILSSDYAVIVIATKELTDILLQGLEE